MKRVRVVIGASLPALLAGMFALASTAWADETGTTNSRKEDRPATGSNIRRDKTPLLSWALPMDKTYDQLSPEEKKHVRSAYEEMPATDEPPYPLFGMGKASEPMSEIQQKLLAQGRVRIDVRVDRNGEAVSATIVETPNTTIGKAVAMVLMHTKFKPAKCGDQRCEMDFPFAFNFIVK